MSERFIKFIPSEEAFWLMEKKPNAFRLLTHIANTARRYNGHPDGLTIGQCHLQSWKVYKLTERQYRTAKEILVQRKHMKIIETNRTRQKSTTGATTASTLVQICSNTIYDINPEQDDDRNDDRATTDRRQTRKNKKEKEDHHPKPSSFFASKADDEKLMTDDFILNDKKKMETQHNIHYPDDTPSVEVLPGIFLKKIDLDQCIAIKGSFESVQQAMGQIIRSPKRVSEIVDWPNTLTNWKIKTDVKPRIQENEEMSKRLEKEYGNSIGWRCEQYVDKNKDQKGVLFYSTSCTGNPETIFVALVDPDFKEKVSKLVRDKKMQKGRFS